MASRPLVRPVNMSPATMRRIVERVEAVLAEQIFGFGCGCETGCMCRACFNAALDRMVEWSEEAVVDASRILGVSRDAS